MKRSFSTGDIVHACSRGVDRRAIFRDDDDRTHLLGLVGAASRDARMRCLHHCLLGNHYHLVLQVFDEPLGDVMRDVLAVYAQTFNRRHGRDGHLFERTYWAKRVDTAAYLFELARYVAMNPVRAGLCARPEDWPWSAHRALLGLSAAGFTAIDALLDHFGGDRRTARANYAALVAGAADDRVFALSEVTVAIDREWRRAAIAAASAASCSTTAIAAAAGCSIRTVQRHVRDKTL